MYFSKGNLAVSKIASQDQRGRYPGLCAVRLNPDGSTVGSNGSMMVVVGPVNHDRVASNYPDVGEQTTPSGDGQSIPLDLAEKASRNMDKGKGMQYVAMTVHRDPRKIQLTCSDISGKQEQSVSSYPVNEPYPAWRDSIRAVKERCTVKICLHRKSLIGLLDAMVAACPNADEIIYMEVGPEAGILLRSVDTETRQRAIGAMAKVKDADWLQSDDWEQEVWGSGVRMKEESNAEITL